MIFQKESYHVTTLSKSDAESIKKCVDEFDALIRELVSINPEFIHVSVTPLSCDSVIKSIGKKEISLCRMTWEIEGEKETLEKFFHSWKEIDQNPFRSFYIRPNYSLGELKELLSLR